MLRMRQVTEIKNCRACGESLPSTHVFTLGTMPLVSFPEDPGDVPLCAPLDLVKCRHCTLVQLRHTVDPDLMFRQYWYRSSVTGTMREALGDVVESAKRFTDLEAGDAVCDIGCNDGTLLSFYPPDVERCGFEPSGGVPRVVDLLEKGIKLVPDFFITENIRKKWERRFKIITAIAMFYDLSDPGQFLEDVKWALAPGGIFVVQMNYLCTMLLNRAVDNIGHEHLAYYSAEAFFRLCAAHRMRIERLETNNVNGGSIRFYVRPGTGYSGEITEFSEASYTSRSAWENFRTGSPSLPPRSAAILWVSTTTRRP